MIKEIHRAIRTIELQVASYTARAKDALISSNASATRFIGLLTAVFSDMALILAVAGIYGVRAFNVSRRTSEIGKRLAPGARNEDVPQMMIKSGLTLTLPVPAWDRQGAYVGIRILTACLHGVTATAPGVFIGVAVLLALVASAGIACLSHGCHSL